MAFELASDRRRKERVGHYDPVQGPVPRGRRPRTGALTMPLCDNDL